MRFHLLALFLLAAISLHAQTGQDASSLYEKGLNALTGAGPGHSPEGAVAHFRRSAELGYAPAQTALGSFYDTGTFVPQEPGQALDWYKKAAMQDNPTPEWLAGRLIYNGAVPPRDLNEASNWLQKSAAHDNPFAEYFLGMIKLERNDYTKAAEWFRKSAGQGLPQAQQQLGLLLKRGQGVPIDKFEAYVWLLVSSDAGNQAVAADLQSLEADLGSAQVEQAKSKARQLELTVTRSVVAHGCTGWPGEFDAVPTPPPVDIQRFCH